MLALKHGSVRTVHCDRELHVVAFLHANLERRIVL